MSIVAPHGIGVVIFYRRTHGIGVVFYVSHLPTIKTNLSQSGKRFRAPTPKAPNSPKSKAPKTQNPATPRYQSQQQRPMPMQPQAPSMTPAAGITTEQIQKVHPFALTFPVVVFYRVRIPALCGVYLDTGGPD
jgi:hypothetical protein